MGKIRVVVCDDLKYMCMFFGDLLNSSETCECVGEANSEREVRDKVKEIQPDVVLLDMQMDTSESGIKLIPEIKELSPQTDIIVISVHEENDKIFKAIQAGARDYLFKNADPDDIIQSIENVYNGKDEIRGDIVRRILDQMRNIEEKQQSILFLVNKMRSLSERELAVVKGVCSGKTYGEIADEINTEVVTVRTYASRILKKMGYSRMSKLTEDLNALGIMRLFKD